MRNVFKKAAAVGIALLLSVGGLPADGRGILYDSCIGDVYAADGSVQFENGILVLSGNITQDMTRPTEYRKAVVVVCEPGTVLPNDCSQLFSDYSSATLIDLSNANTANVINMSYMFYNCNSLTSVDYEVHVL